MRLQWEGFPGLHAAVAGRDFTRSKEPGSGNIKLMLLSFCRHMLIVIADTRVLESRQNIPLIDSVMFLYWSSALLETVD